MFTPIDIQQKTFKSGFGYKKGDVNAFMAALLESYEHLYKENLDLNDRIKTLTQSLAQYKNIEKSLQKALILAQNTAEDVRTTANSSAKLIEEEARNKAKMIISQARKELEAVHSKTLALASQMEVYKAQCKQAALAQVALLDTDAFNIDLKKLESYMPIEGENESLNFIDELKDEVRINKFEQNLTEQSEKMLNAAAVGEATGNDDEVNKEFYDLVEEVMEGDIPEDDEEVKVEVAEDSEEE